MLKTNWQENETYTPSEMNATEQEIKANDTAVTNHISNENNPHNVTKEQVGLNLVQNVSDLNWPLTKDQKDKLEDLSEIDFSNVQNTVFKDKCDELGIGGAEIIPDNITRVRVIITSYNSALEDVEITYYKYIDNTVTTPLSSVDVSITDGEGYIDLESGYYYQVEGKTLPPSYALPKSTLRFYATPGKLKTVYLYFGEVTPVKYSITINEANSNPEAAVTYGNDCVNFISAKTTNVDTWTWGSWADKWPFNQIKPCLLRNKSEFEGKSEVLTYLNPNDYTKDIDGTDVTNIIETGSDGYFDVDVMVEFPTDFDFYIGKANDNITVTLVKGSANPPAGPTQSRWNYYQNSPISKLYISAYRSTISNSDPTVGHLRSRSNQKISTINASNFLQGAHNKGAGYEPINLYQMEMLRVLYLLLCKNINSQQAFGMGCGYGLGDQTLTGVLNKSGMYYGNLTTETLNKIFGIEGLASGRGHLIFGSWIENGKVYLKTDGFDDYTTYFESREYTLPTDNGFITKMNGMENGGLILPSSYGGSATTYYGDYGYISDAASGERLYLVWNRNDNTNNISRLGMFGLRFIDNTEWSQNNYNSYFVYNML